MKVKHLVKQLGGYGEESEVMVSSGKPFRVSPQVVNAYTDDDGKEVVVIHISVVDERDERKVYLKKLFERFYVTIEENWGSSYGDRVLSMLIKLIRDEDAVFLISDDPVGDEYHVAIAESSDESNFIFKDKDLGLDFSEYYDEMWEYRIE